MRAKMRSLLETLDVDGDGNIDESELLRAVETLVSVWYLYYEYQPVSQKKKRQHLKHMIPELLAQEPTSIQRVPPLLG